jgi:cold shock CspA family protein
MSSFEIHVGQCKWFNDRLGYGFLTVVQPGPMLGKDIFIHHSGIQPQQSSFKSLSKGEYVSFSTITTQNGSEHACNVKGVFGGTLMCDHTVFRQRTTENIINMPVTSATVINNNLPHVAVGPPVAEE